LKVLFVSSGNSDFFEIAPFIKSQGESLKKIGVDLDYFTIKGKGIRGYLRNIPHLRKKIKDGGYDLVHAHYSLSAIVTSLATSRTVIVSLMGSDVQGSSFWRFVIRLYSSFKWREIIVKSEEMRQKIKIRRAHVIPNGVDLEVFNNLDKEECKEKLNLEKEKNYILFAADPDRKVKNYPLAEKSCSQLITHNSQLITLGKTPHEKIPLYLNACDVLILTSLWEGSPNIIKEAMACNCPIVSTDVGDVRWLLGDIEGHYIAKHDPQDFAEKIKLALYFGKKTKGRERIIELGLDSESVARRVLEVYKKSIEL